MNTLQWLSCWALSAMCGLSFADTNNDAPRKPKGVETTQVQRGGLVPPRVVEPCKPDQCPFAGQRVTVLVTDHVPIRDSLWHYQHRVAQGIKTVVLCEP